VVVEAQRYALFALRLAAQQVREGGIDVVHAHDWMTFPAAMAVAAHTGRPFVAHVHSTEYDRSGERVDGRIADIERRACHAAMRVIAVSKYTRSVLVERYGVPESKIDVVYNGIEDWGIEDRDDTPVAPDVEQTLPPRNGGYPTVLFLGRVTMQKGPEYFIQAAKRVLEKVPDTRFVVAGSGDQVHRVIDQAAREGIGHRVFFTGFLKGSDVDRAFRMADVYVMPSVSEPFGLAALEAIRADVPVIVSKQSGVAEVIEHALKVDFWDTHAIAEKIIAVLRRPPLASTLTSHADRELKKLTWGEAAARTLASYEASLAGMA
jgi:glycosyltransferase involved in cell wall biosynthesis